MRTLLSEEGNITIVWGSDYIWRIVKWYQSMVMLSSLNYIGRLTQTPRHRASISHFELFAAGTPIAHFYLIQVCKTIHCLNIGLKLVKLSWTLRRNLMLYFDSLFLLLGSVWVGTSDTGTRKHWRSVKSFNEKPLFSAKIWFCRYVVYSYMWFIAVYSCS